MKKILFVFLSVLIVVLLFSCKSKDPDEETAVPFQNEQESDISGSVGDNSESDQTYTSAENPLSEQNSDIADIESNEQTNSENEEKNLDDNSADSVVTVESDAPYIEHSVSDVPPVKFSSVEQMVSSIKENKAPKTYEYNFDSLNIADIDYFYAPTAGISGYQLEKILVSYWNIEYVYVPTGEENVTESDYIIIMYRRHERTSDKQLSLESIASANNTKVTEDGFVYLQSINQMFFSAGESVCCIRVPDSMNNYETLKPLCVAEKITIE